MRRPGFEPGLSRWQRDVLTTELPSHIREREGRFLKVIICVSRDILQEINEYKLFSYPIYMNFRNVGSIKYRVDLNNIECDRRSRKALEEFFAEHGTAAIMKGLNLLIKRLIPKTEGDVHLEGFFAEGNAFCRMKDIPTHLSMVIYPSKGQVKRYVLSDAVFFSNAHTNPDPLIITNIDESLYLHPECRDDFFRLRPVGRVFTDFYIPSLVHNGVFFKRNPFLCPKDYEGFQRFMDYNPCARR